MGGAEIPKKIDILPACTVQNNISPHAGNNLGAHLNFVVIHQIEFGYAHPFNCAAKACTKWGN